MTANENTSASVTVWYFVGATFVITTPMLMFPELAWWARVASIAFGGALIVVGIRRMQREKTDEGSPNE